MPRSQKNGKIEFMRFIFAVCIILLHINKDWWDGTKLLFKWGGISWSLCKHGNMGVEFFFLTSGFLMAQSISKKRVQEESNPGAPSIPIADETLSFLWKKVKSFLPYHCIFYGFAIVVFILRRPENLMIKLLQYIPSFF